MEAPMIFTFAPGINVLALLASAVASLVIGFAWYGPLFAKPWSRYTGWTDEKVKQLPASSMAVTYGLTFVAAAVQALVLMLFARSLGATTWTDGLLLGAVAGAAFSALAFAVTFLFEHKPLGLWLIVSGYEVVYLAVAGLVVTVWA
jgi:hypothetical protein